MAKMKTIRDALLYEILDRLETLSDGCDGDLYDALGKPFSELPDLPASPANIRACKAGVAETLAKFQCEVAKLVTDRFDPTSVAKCLSARRKRR